MGASPAGATEMGRGWSPSPGKPGWESWGCSAWRRAGSGGALEQLPAPEGAGRKAGGGLLTGACVTGHGGGFERREGRCRSDIRKNLSP